MKLFSSEHEHSALRAICGRNQEISSFLLGSLDESFFHHDPCLAAFQRVYSLAKQRSYVIPYSELLADPNLEEEYRDILRDSQPRIYKTKEHATQLYQTLDKYRKARAIYTCVKETSELLNQPKVDVDALLNSMADFITEARSRESITELVHSIGKDGNAIDLVDEALSPEDEILFKTGFIEIDERNGGVPSEGVMLLAATTSGGKSAMLQNLLMNMYRINKINVANVSLEMNERKLTRRILSRLTQIPYWKYVKRALSTEEHSLSKKAWRRFHRFGEKNNCQFSMVCPKHSVNMTQLLMMMKPYGYKVIGIDYISLLEGVDEKDQWRALSSITRQAKIFSAENKCLVILLAQLDADDDRIRYSKGILEHADCAWTWNYYKPEVRETKTMPIRQLKARDQELFPFELREMFETMTVGNMEDSGASSESGESGESAGTSTKTSQTKKSSSSGSDLDLNSDVEVGYDAGQA